MNKSKGTTAYKTNCTDCGSSNAKQVFNKEDGTQDAFCYACDKYDPMGNHTTVTKNYKEYTQTMTMPDVSKLKSLEIPDRMISKDTVEYYGVRLALSEVDGTTITEHYYPDHNNRTNRL